MKVGRAFSSARLIIDHLGRVRGDGGRAMVSRAACSQGLHNASPISCASRLLSLRDFDNKSFWVLIVHTGVLS